MGERINPWEFRAGVLANARWEAQQYKAIDKAIARLVQKALALHHSGYAFDYLTGVIGMHAEAWRAEHPEPRLRPVQRKIRIPHRLRTEVYERDEYACRHCGSRRNLNIDHVHPVSKGGATVLENLQTLCHSCNSKKGATVA